jgi:hypothetical protein
MRAMSTKKIVTNRIRESSQVEISRQKNLITIWNGGGGRRRIRRDGYNNPVRPSNFNATTQKLSLELDNRQKKENGKMGKREKVLRLPMSLKRFFFSRPHCGNFFLRVQ